MAKVHGLRGIECDCLQGISRVKPAAHSSGGGSQEETAFRDRVVGVDVNGLTSKQSQKKLPPNDE